MTTLGLNYLTYKEQQRSNLIKEAETMRSNLANEDRQNRELGEKIRANQAGEAIKLSQLAEDTRHNKTGESLQARDISEKERSNLVKEAQNARALSETERKNKADESIKTKQLEETAYHNRQDELIQNLKIDISRNDLSELIRHNEITESQKRDELLQKSWADYASQLNDIASKSSGYMKTALQIASAGAATTGMQQLTGNSVVDQAIDTVKKELTDSLSTSMDPEERAQVEETINNIDANVRSYTAKVVGGMLEAGEFLSGLKNKAGVESNIATIFGDVLDNMSKGLSDAVGGGKLGDTVADVVKDAIHKLFSDGSTVSGMYSSGGGGSTFSGGGTHF